MSYPEESALRRPEFDPESVPVEWPGAGTWHLPRPRICYRRSLADGRTVGVRGWTFGPDYETLLDRLEASGSDAAFIGSLFDLAADLLSRNYALTADQIDGLLVFVPHDDAEAEGLPAPWDEVLRIARGAPPKASGPGSSRP